MRAGELASLMPSCFDLTADPPVIRVQAAYTKNSEEACQPIPVALGAALERFLATKPQDGLVWPGTWHEKSARMLRKDLAVAKIPYKTEDGYADFHALRHGYISMLVKSGVHPKVAQTLARHSTITLTMDRYTHIGLFDTVAAVEGLPAFFTAPESHGQRLLATGTECVKPLGACTPACTKLARTADNERELLLLDEKAVGDSHECQETQIPRESTGFASNRERLRSVENKGERGESNPQPPEPQSGALPIELLPPCSFLIIKLTGKMARLPAGPRSSRSFSPRLVNSSPKPICRRPEKQPADRGSPAPASSCGRLNAYPVATAAQTEPCQNNAGGSGGPIPAPP